MNIFRPIFQSDQKQGNKQACRSLHIRVDWCIDNKGGLELHAQLPIKWIKYCKNMAGAKIKCVHK